MGKLRRIGRKTWRMARAVLINIALVCVAIVASILVMEGAFYLLNPSEMKGICSSFQSVDIHSSNGQAGPNEYHPVYGMNGIPNLKVGGPSPITHNSRGNRGPEVSHRKEQDTKRIVVLGDSNVWGFGLASEEQAFPAVLEKKMRERFPGTRAEVLNLGITGSGTDQQLLKLLVEGLRYSPDLVILGYFQLNDILEATSSIFWGVSKPYFYLESGKLCLANIPPPVAKSWPNHNLEAIAGEFAGNRSWLQAAVKFLFEHSHTGQFFCRRQLMPWLAFLKGKWDLRTFIDFQGLPPLARSALDSYLDCPRGEPEHGNGVQLVITLINEMKRVSKESGAQFVVTMTPTLKDYIENYPDATYIKIRQGLLDSSIPVIDMLAYGRGGGFSGREMFQPDGAHFSALGQEQEADAVIGVLPGMDWK